MADNNKVFLGTNKDTYIAADDAGNIVMQHEAGNRVEVTSDSLKSNSIQLGNTKILTDETGALVSSIDGGENQPLGGGGEEPLSYEFSTMISTADLQYPDPILDNALESQRGYLDFTTNEIVPANSGGYFAGGARDREIFRNNRSKSINITQLWQDFIGRSLTDDDAVGNSYFSKLGVGPGPSEYYIGFNGDNPPLANANSNLKFFPATFSFDYEYNVNFIQGYDSAGQNVKGTMTLCYTKARDSQTTHLGYIWRPHLAGELFHPGNTITVTPEGINREWNNGQNWDNGDINADFGKSLPLFGGISVSKVWSPYTLLSPPNYSIQGYPSFLQYLAPEALYAGATDANGNLFNIVDFTHLQTVSTPFMGATLKYDLKLSNFRAMDSEIG